MRMTGTLVDWKDDRGFGFIEPADGGARVFCHISVFEVRVRRPMAGDRLTFEVVTGKDGRPSAARVRPVGLEKASYQENVSQTSNREHHLSGSRSGMLSKWAVIVLLALVGAGFYAFNHREKVGVDSSARVGNSQSEVGRSSAAVGNAQSEVERSSSPVGNSQSDVNRSSDVLRRAFEQRQINIQVSGVGVVDRVLSDDTAGSRHQRFILRLSSGQTLLIAHNIDLAQRISALRVGDHIEFKGEYVWNEQVGLVHWTHHDPDGRHEAGWLKRNGEVFQ